MKRLNPIIAPSIATLCIVISCILGVLLFKSEYKAQLVKLELSREREARLKIIQTNVFSNAAIAELKREKDELRCNSLYSNDYQKILNNLLLTSVSGNGAGLIAGRIPECESKPLTTTRYSDYDIGYKILKSLKSSSGNRTLVIFGFDAQIQGFFVVENSVPRLDSWTVRVPSNPDSSNWIEGPRWKDENTIVYQDFYGTLGMDEPSKEQRVLILK